MNGPNKSLQAQTGIRNLRFHWWCFGMGGIWNL